MLKSIELKVGDTLTVKGVTYIVEAFDEHESHMKERGWTWAAMLRRPKGRKSFYANVAFDGFIGDLIALGL